MWALNKFRHLPLLVLFLFLQFNAIWANSKLVDTESSENNHKNSLSKRQSGTFGFQQNGPSSNNFYPHPIPINGGQNHLGPNHYDSFRGGPNLINSNSRIDHSRDREYYPSSSTYTAGRSNSIGGGVGSYYNYNNRGRDDYNRDYYRDRQPAYYDDYRYNNNYPARDREAAAAQNMEFIMRNGQQRHAEYQKRVGHSGQDSYDPFYFIGVRNQNGNGIDGIAPLGSIVGSKDTSFLPPPTSSSSSPANGGSGLLPPSSTSSAGSTNSNPGPSTSSAPHPLRNRRNSHQLRANDYFSNDIDGGKYEIMSIKKNAYPSSLDHHQHHHHRDNRYHNNPQQRWPNHQFDRQFLTREQLVRQHPDSKVDYPPQYHHRQNFDLYGPTISSASGQPWSVRIGTQLKVNDDGRDPNPHRFYVRDEINPGRNRSRYPGPIYRRK